MVDGTMSAPTSSTGTSWLLVVALTIAIPIAYALGLHSGRSDGAEAQQAKPASALRASALDHVLRAKKLIRATVPSTNVDQFDAAMQLLSGEPELLDAEQELLAAGDDRFTINTVAALRSQIVQRRQTVAALRAEFAHLQSASALMSQAESQQRGSARANSHVTARKQLAEARLHLAAIPSTSLLNDAATEFRATVRQLEPHASSPAIFDRAAGVGAAVSERPRSRAGNATLVLGSGGLGCAENGSCYGDTSAPGDGKTVEVRGYTRSDGTYVRGHMRSR